MATGSYPGHLRLTANPTNYSLETLHPPKRKSYHKVPSSMRNNAYLTHPDLTKGQKKYLWSICSIYSTAQMKQLVQDQFIQQLFYEMGKGIIRTADWNKYLEYLADPKKRKHQFQNISPRAWKAPPDQYKFRHFRKHPVNLPAPPVPCFIEEEIRDWTRPTKPPAPNPVRYVSKQRRGGFNRAPAVTSSRQRNGLPSIGGTVTRPHTSLGFNSKSSDSSFPSYSTNFSSGGDSSTNGASDAGQEQELKSFGEGITRPKSRIGRRLPLGML